MIVHLCDRCRAEASPSVSRTVIVPVDALSTLPVTADAEVRVTVDTGELCAPCRAAALLEYVSQTVGAAAADAIVAAATAAATGTKKGRSA